MTIQTIHSSRHYTDQGVHTPSSECYDIAGYGRVYVYEDPSEGKSLPDGSLL